jgi:hypothetical protein
MTENVEDTENFSEKCLLLRLRRRWKDGLKMYIAFNQFWKKQQRVKVQHLKHPITGQDEALPDHTPAPCLIRPCHVDMTSSVPGHLPQKLLLGGKVLSSPRHWRSTSHSQSQSAKGCVVSNGKAGTRYVYDATPQTCRTTFLQRNEWTMTTKVCTFLRLPHKMQAHCSVFIIPLASHFQGYQGPTVQ